jgi:dienelactone hydrolase
MRTLFLTFILFCGMIPAAFAAVQTQEIEYKSNDKILKGYLAYDDASDAKRPGVIVVHEWWGHNEYSRKRARMLAELGYVALAIDMYGDGKTAAHPSQAGEFAKEVMSNQDQAKARFLAGLDVLKNFHLTDASRIGAIGYCFGGATVLNMALAGVDLKAVVSFHGSLPTPPADLKHGQVKAKVLVCHGGDDQFITQEQISTFKNGLDAAKVDYQFKIYPGAKHSFTNPDADQLAAKFNMPISYNQEADQQSWHDMQEFFRLQL